MDSLPILIVVSGIQSKRRHHSSNSSSLRYPVKERLLVISIVFSIVYGLGTSQFAYIDDTANNGSFEDR
jgi:hypothetical protein